MKYILLYAALLLAPLLSMAQRSAVFAPKGIAIQGYDPVAFFTEHKPVMGADSLSYTWQDAQWRFSSQKHLNLFKANPEGYAPQYGGYCAYGTADGHKAPTKVETWTIEQGKLYFNYNEKVKERWVKDIPGYIQKADQNWPVIKDKE